MVDVVPTEIYAGVDTPGILLFRTLIGKVCFGFAYFLSAVFSEVLLKFLPLGFWKHWLCWWWACSG